MFHFCNTVNVPSPVPFRFVASFYLPLCRPVCCTHGHFKHLETGNVFPPWANCVRFVFFVFNCLSPLLAALE